MAQDLDFSTTTASTRITVYVKVKATTNLNRDYTEDGYNNCIARNQKKKGNTTDRIKWV